MTSIVLLLIFPFFAISTVLFVHEMGHFIAARRTRTPIEQVAIGFGPELISWRDENETKWVIGLFPGTAWINLRENGDEKAAPCRELLARATTQIGGPLANVIFALMVLVSLPLAVGVPVSSTLVSGVVEGGPADLAGIQPGDRILSIDGHRVRSMSEIMELNRHRPGHTIKVRLSKGGLEQELMVTLRAQELGSGKAIGVMGFRSLPEVQRPSIGEAVIIASDRMAAESATTLKAAFSPFTKDPLSELGGPLKLIQAANAAASTLEEFATLLSYTAVISVHMAIFNLLPLSFLDGGHLIMTLREAVSGRAASKRLIKLHWIFSVAFIVALSLLGIYHDLEAIGVLRWLLQNT